MQKQKVEIAVGIFVVLGLAALVMLAMKVSNLSALSGNAGYYLTARFDNIGGLKVRSPVNMAGVRIGQVTAIRLDQATFEAVVMLRVSEQFNQLPLDTSASVYTSGLLGEQYISLEPGGEETFLADGAEIKITSSSFVLEQVIGEVLFSKAAGEDK